MTEDRVSVLLVEDNPGDARLVELALEEAKEIKFSSTHVDRLQAAADLFSKNSFDVVLLDLNLPDHQGLETLQYAMEAFQGLPIVVLTGLGENGLAEKALQSGAQDFLVKHDLAPEGLVRSIRYSMERNRVQRELARLNAKLHAANSKLEQLAGVDPLTGLLNRRGLEKILYQEASRARREGTDLLALFLDLDDFKEINDTLGYSVGDVVLKEVTRKLKGSLRVFDHAARVGGDEFLVLLPATRVAEGARIAERIRLGISDDPVRLPYDALKLTASFALFAVPQPYPTLDEILLQGHPLLSRSKKSGKNRVSSDAEVVAGRPQEAEREDLAAVPRDLRRVEKFRVVVQPIYRLEDEAIVGCETFSRAPIAVFENPEDFFRIAFQFRMLTQVDRRCFRSCLAAGAGFSKDLEHHLNLFPSTMIHLPLRTLLGCFPPDSPKSRYCVEISEQQIIGEPSYLSAAVQGLKKEGVRVAIDDVGFGRSCIESLVVLEPDQIKIDKQFIQGIGEDPIRRKNLKRLLQIARSLDAEVVAEGVEQRDELRVLRDLGVPLGQGYYWGKPVELAS